MEIMEKKKKFRDYPNSIGHMALWGFGSGTVLATVFVVYFWFWVGQAISYTDILPLTFMAIFTPILGFFFGGVPGIICGLLSGWILSLVMRPALVPFTWKEVQNYRLTAYTLVALVTGISSYFMTLWLSMFWESFGTSSPSELFLTPFIAALLSIFAAHRYMLRLWLRDEQEYGIEKAKTVERLIDHLEDKAKVDETDFDEEESKEHETS